MLSRLFLSHPRSVEESYLEHLLFAGRFGATLLLAAGAALLHALLPFCCEKTASRMVAQLYHQTRNRGVPAEASRLPVHSAQG
ncbi:MAG: DUF6356 family protein [Rhodospirillales bacterium]